MRSAQLMLRDFLTARRVSLITASQFFFLEDAATAMSSTKDLDDPWGGRMITWDLAKARTSNPPMTLCRTQWGTVDIDTHDHSVGLDLYRKYPPLRSLRSVEVANRAWLIFHRTKLHAKRSRSISPDRSQPTNF